MANGTGLTTYKEKYDALTVKLRRIGEAAKAPIAQVVATASGIAGGVAAGALDAKLPMLGPIPVPPVVGALAVVGAIMNAEESWASSLNSFGTTMIGVVAAKETYKLLTQNSAPATPTTKLAA